MAETVNLPRDSTLRELVAVQKASIIASGNAAAIDRLYGSLVRAAKSVEEVNTLFVDWWNICWKEGVTTRNELCGRWFGTVLDDNRVHGTKDGCAPLSAGWPAPAEPPGDCVAPSARRQPGAARAPV